MKFFITAFALYISFNLHAQITFEGESLLDFEFDTILSVADIDGDGDADILSSNFWCKNLDGLGNFGLPNIIDEEFRSVLWVDWDNDGDIDRLNYTSSSTQNESFIWWNENIDGEGNFSQEQFIIECELIRTLNVADFDEDNDLDIVISSNNSIYWYENLNASDNFSLAQVIDENVVTFNLRPVDIDNDGNLDIVSFDESGVFWYNYSSNLESFSTRIPIIDEPNIREARSADIDNDGDNDIIIGTGTNSGNDGKIIYLENLDALGQFDNGSLLFSSTFDRIDHLYLVDLDTDGDIDITGSGDDNVFWIENTDGEGNFSSRVELHHIGDRSNILASDLNQDGFIDLIYSTTWQEHIDGQGTFEYEHFPIPIVTNRYISIDDYDEDGYNDVLASVNGKLILFSNENGEGNFDEAEIIQNDILLNPFHTTSGDIDNDGDEDLITGGSDSFDVVVLKKLNNGSFMEVQSLISLEPNDNIDTNLVRTVLKDIDGDNDLDYIILSQSSTFFSDTVSQIRWYENLGNGFFNDSVQLDTEEAFFNSLISVDLDQDGLNDLLYSNGSNLFWIRSLGSGNFSDRQTLPLNSNEIRSLAADDLDNDGDIDIVTGSGFGLKPIAWYENIDNFEFLERTVVDNGAGYRESLKTIDIDNDGDSDIVSVKDNTISWYANNGSGSFGIGQTITTPSITLSSSLIFDVADINGDGMRDVVSSHSRLAVRELNLDQYLNQGVTRNIIEGDILVDFDNNGCSENDFGVPNLLITSESDVETISTFSNNGSYQLITNEGTYITQITGGVPSYFSGSPDSYDTTFEGIGNLEQLNFCLEATGSFNDLEINLYPLTNARPGFDSSYLVLYKNIGSTVQSGNVHLSYDGERLSLINTNTTISDQTDTSLTFEYEDLMPFQSENIILTFNVLPPPVNEIDDILSFQASVNLNNNDETPENNAVSRDYTIVGSFDPNDILVLEGSEIPIEAADDYLHYIIRFQNTGTAPATFVRVTNPLDTNLDWTTMQLESLSHPGVVNITNGNEVEFFFEGINLPAEIDDPEGSNGYIAYRIKPVEGLDIGDTIFNDAAIFFDFNPPIITNTVSTTVVDQSLSFVDNELTSLIRLFPNPSKNSITIDSEIVLSEIEVYNTIGTTVLRKINPKGIDSINIEELTSGIYFVKISNKEKNNSVIRKIVKQ